MTGKNTSDKSLLIVIPAYNEAKRLALTLEKCLRQGTTLVIDDGSVDGTGAVANKLGALILTHDYNFGYEVAIQSGLQFFLKSEYEKVIFIDADGEIDVDCAMDLAKKVNAKTPIGLGFRENFNRTSEKTSAKLSLLLFGVRDPFCGCKCFHKSILCCNSVNLLSKRIFSAVLVYLINERLNFVQEMVQGKQRLGVSKFSKSRFLADLKLFYAFARNILQIVKKKILT